MAKPQRIAVVGAGWAGCAAAVDLVRQGHAVSLFEAARTLGGRARRVALAQQHADNGQHILLGAYRSTLTAMRTVGVIPKQVLLRLPLQMCYPDAGDGMHFVAPRWPAPLHLAWALLRARGLDRADKLALARFSTAARWMGWTLHHDCSVAELLQRFDQTERLCRLMWVPLCIAALNTPPQRASAQVFLNVLRDSLGANRAASDMLIPTTDLSALFPEPAAAFVERHGGRVHRGAHVRTLHRQDDRVWSLDCQSAGSEEFDRVILATPATQAGKLLAGLSGGAPAAGFEFDYEAITTCYLQYPTDLRLPRAFFALTDAPAQGDWGQFVFDRAHLNPQQRGLLAVVVSAAGDAGTLPQAELAAAIAGQLSRQFARPELAHPLWHKLITEKRATFSCRPGLERPDNRTGVPGLYLAGDYTAGAYPATLEAAVRSGQRAAALVCQDR